MRMSFKIAMQSLVGALMVGALWGCGSASNNDQGASFTLFQMTPSSSSVPLSTSEEGTTSTGALTGTYGFQNNLLGQGIRLQRVFLRFFVEGSSEQPPETTVAIGAVLGPAGPAPADPDGSDGGSLPEGFENIPNSASISAFMLPPEIMSWLNLNRSLLPEPPYSITIEAYATGITTAGDRLDTNPLGTSVTITPDVVIDPSEEGDDEEGGSEETETVSGGDSSEEL